MSGVDPDIDAELLPTFGNLHKVALGVALGVVFGVCVLVMTAALLLRGGEVVGPNLALLGQFFFGYTVTWPGAIIGFAWGFATGFVLGWSFAFLRNMMISLWLALVAEQQTIEEVQELLDSE